MIENVATFIFWFSISVILYTYLGYPIILKLLGLFNSYKVYVERLQK